jgi:eukaryotic-like serine/threonine-protein kinase
LSDDVEDTPADGAQDTFERLLRAVAHAPSMDPSQLAAVAAPRGERVGQLMAHFRLERWLGAGGMGEVYLAQDTRLRRPVALKVLLAERCVERAARERFLREARSAAAVVHPRIASIYEAGEAGAVPYIAMEYLSGETLRARLQRQRLTRCEALQCALAVAEGLAAAHAAGILHRDLKPDNVMLVADGQVKLLDFGLARPLPAHGGLPGVSVSVELTAEGEVLGTPNYMSPEQARACAVDARSDVYSFGVLLHELLAGARPAQARAPLPRTSAALSRLLCQCLAQEPAQRPADGRALLAALRRIPELRRGARVTRLLLPLLAIGAVLAAWGLWRLG